MSRYQKFQEAMEAEGVETWGMEDVEWMDEDVRKFDINTASIHTIRDEMEKAMSQYERDDWLLWEVCRGNALLEKFEAQFKERSSRLYSKEYKHEVGLQSLGKEVAALQELVLRFETDISRQEMMLARREMPADDTDAYPAASRAQAEAASSASAAPEPEPAPAPEPAAPQAAQPQAAPPAAAHGGRWGSGSPSVAARQAAQAVGEARPLVRPSPELQAQALSAARPPAATAAVQPVAPMSMPRSAEAPLPSSRPPPPPVPAGHVPPAGGPLAAPGGLLRLPVFAGAPRAVGAVVPMPPRPVLNDDEEPSDSENPWQGMP